MRIVLASASPFRKRALELLGLPFETMPSAIDEKAIRHDDPIELTRALSEAKARTIAGRVPNGIIVAGDAVAAKNGRIYEKPCDKNEAIQFLNEFSGGDFQFVTALAVLNSATGKLLSTVETLNITFRQLSDQEIRAYVERYPVTNYAGAFENDAVHMFAERIGGSYNIGTAFPVSRLILFLRDHGVEV
jgi:MAF protein